MEALWAAVAEFDTYLDCTFGDTDEMAVLTAVRNHYPDHPSARYFVDEICRRSGTRLHENNFYSRIAVMMILSWSEFSLLRTGEAIDTTTAEELSVRFFRRLLEGP